MAFCLALIVFLSVELSTLTVDAANNSDTVATYDDKRTVALSGARGSIMDSNGVLLAYDVSCYNVEFYKDPAERASSYRAKYTDIIRKTIALIERNGGSTIDTFLIRKDSTGAFAYDLASDLSDSVREARIKTFRSNMQVSEDVTEPEEIYYDLRNKYRIPEDASYEEAMKILSIWQETQYMAFKSYIPVTIAYDVDFNTVAEIYTRAAELKGMGVSESNTRVYPKQDVASHIIGYMGRMVSESETSEYVDAKGYSPDDSIGKTGIEATMEDYLTGSSKEKQGQKVLEVDQNGTVVDTVSYIAPKKGDNVVLNIDLKLQQVVEEALAQNIADGYAEQLKMYEENKNSTDPRVQKYDELLEKRSVKEISWLKSGACIVMEVKTGKVLALASYPGYDLNLFAGGIDHDVFQGLNDDPAKPLFNNAISSVSTPGSVFKMCTGIAGLMEGVIDVNTVINDEGPYHGIEILPGADAPECWTKNYRKHADSQNIEKALKNSCNYFFYEVAHRLGIEKLTGWADQFGLTSKTNVELTYEIAGWVGNQSVLYDYTKPINEQRTYKAQIVFNKLKTVLRGYGEQRNIEYTDKQLETAATRIIAETGQRALNELGEPVRQILSEELDIPQKVSRTTLSESGVPWYSEIVDIIRELKWTDVDTVTSGIGAGLTQVSPIALTRYIAAIANGGKVLEAHLVDKIVDSSGNVVKQVEPTVVSDLQIPEEYLNAVKRGMEQVVSEEDGGTAGAAFKDFKYKDIISGKTGTAPVSEIELEDNICMALFAPREDPEIAVVVFLPNGLSESVKAYPTAKAAIQYYFDSKNEAETKKQPSPIEGSMMEEAEFAKPSESKAPETASPEEGVGEAPGESPAPTESQTAGGEPGSTKPPIVI